MLTHPHTLFLKVKTLRSAPPPPQNTEFTIKLKQLMDSLLISLSNAEGDLTENVALIESLEQSKALADEISEKVGRGAARGRPRSACCRSAACIGTAGVLYPSAWRQVGLAGLALPVR